MVKSSIEMTNSEFMARENFAKPGEEVDNMRDMAGQAPYIINGGISYKLPESGMDAGFFYNVKGSTLIVVGGGLFPDVYAKPFHSMNFNLNKDFGNKVSFNINVTNILNSTRFEAFTGFEAIDQVYTRFNPGRSFGIGVKYSVY